MRKQRLRQRFIGIALTCIGAVGGVIMLAQPWRSCPEIDDSPAGCPATSADANLLLVFLLVFAAGVFFWILSARFIPREQG